ncbi:MAG: TetM/TetW/TetO/TetS family tetracycline resistance ribosomal protection protein, partial [Lachnospiraceae bacterium]|nr:TetM/TetW/TetO/TetS family tetracycline resistance ribosomal protection protein [Lachnospiraceae bacterium]
MHHHTTLGVLAHVDAGKTTLSEAILYQTGEIRTAGRVDHGDTHLDTDRMERDRGITIFSKMARFSCARIDAETDLQGPNLTGAAGSDARKQGMPAQEKSGGSAKDTDAASLLHVTLLDTPGHVDFSAETERTLQVLDYALLIVSGPDGVQGHTRTLWRLLRTYGIPTFLFVNKMDLTERSRGEILQELRRDLDAAVVDFTLEDTAWAEETATCDESLLDAYMEDETLPVSAVRAAIAERKIFPVRFGSALRMEGVTELVAGLGKWMADYGELVSIYGKMSHPAQDPGTPDSEETSDGTRRHPVREPGSPNPEEKTARGEKGRISSEAAVTGLEDGPFAARVFKVGRDRTGGKLTYLKVLSGTLHVKDTVPYITADGTEYTEKVDQIRLYSGDRFETAQAAGPGEVAAVTGLTMTRPGMGAGEVREAVQPVLMPVMTRAMVLPLDQSAAAFYRKVKELAEEDPSLRLTWNAKTGEIRAEVMGNVQIEVLTHMIEERFGVRVTFGPEQILYKETIAAPVRGIGHFEPLRHYAEVQLLLEPGGRGSGITTASACSEDVLALNWQRLILTHVLEREHPGVLTGAPVTDLKVTVLTGKAHIKHTEGGDFRQATYRAIRQGLMCAQNVLLEPYYSFLLDVPADTVGRAMTDLTARFAEMSPPEISDDGMRAHISGKAPVAAISDYMTEVHAYTKGTGSLSLVPEGYGPCHNPEEVLAASQYDPELDAENPSASVFCSHGAGVLVPWDEVAHFAHCDAEDGPAFSAEDGEAETGFLEDG